MNKYVYKHFIKDKACFPPQALFIKTCAHIWVFHFLNMETIRDVSQITAAFCINKHVLLWNTHRFYENINDVTTYRPHAHFIKKKESYAISCYLGKYP